MANLRRVIVTWTGATGLPGVSVFYTAAADDVTTNLATWFNAIKALFPSTVKWGIPGAGDTIDDASGTLVGGWSGGTSNSIAATGTAAYGAGNGTFIRWGTGTIVGGRRLKGRTFLAPMSQDVYDTDGSIFAASVTLINTSTAVLVTTNKLRIWHRPLPGTFSGGSSAQVTDGLCSDLASSLKTRRH